MLDESQRAWEAVRVYIGRTCGVVLAADQNYLLNGRLDPVARERGFASVATFVDAACRTEEEHPLAQALIYAMTTHESFFFRDTVFWKIFEETVVPQALARKDAILSFWCAACAHGQEPYTIAMILEERWPELAARARIWATDVSTPAVVKAAAGIFTGLEVNRGLNAARIQRHFEPARGGFRIKDTLRTRITWGTHNLLNDRPVAEGLDVVLCRNVLIYMDDTGRRPTLKNLSTALSSTGYLGVGATEMVANLPSQTGWYRKDQLATRLL